MNKFFGLDADKFTKIAEDSIKFLKYESTSIKLLSEGLEIFEALGIVKHERRKHLLLSIKKLLENEPNKIKDLIYMISLYPTKIKTKAFE